MTTHANPSTKLAAPESLRRTRPRPTRRTWSAEHREDEDRAITHALSILTARFKSRDVLSSPSSMKDYLRLQSQGLAHEVFAVAFLDARNRLIAYERMIRLLDHVIISDDDALSMVEVGMLAR